MANFEIDMENEFEKYKVNGMIRLRNIKTDENTLCVDKKGGNERLDNINARLDKLQETLYTENKNRLLIVLQAMDTGGKDGTIKSIFKGLNPQGVRVKSFKVPTEEELSHDYLWRVHQNVPRNGEIAIFNRSHYEDVGVTRVHGIISEETCKKRYEQIRNFEKMLYEEGTSIIKFFLHISKDEQKKRLEERISDPIKRHKFNMKDLEERKLWDQYMKAYEEAISNTSTDYSPWYVIPADRNWYRNLAVASVTLNALEKMNLQLPKVDLGNIMIE